MRGARAVSRRSRRSRRFLFPPADSLLATRGVQRQPHCVVRPAMNQKSRHFCKIATHPKCLFISYLQLRLEYLKRA